MRIDDRQRRDITILGIHSGALGDVVLFGQFLEALRAKRRGRVRLVAGGEKGALLGSLAVVDESLDFDALPMEQVFSTTPAGRCDLPQRLGRCELLVSCFATGDDRAQQRLVEFTSARQGLFLPVRPPAGNDDKHLLDLWADLAGLDTLPPPAWSVPDSWRRRARAVLRAAGVDADRPYVLVHPGAGGRAKCWPLENFIELAKTMSSPSGAEPVNPVFVAGPAELHWWAEQELAALRDQFAVLLCPELMVLAGAAAEAAAYLGNDSGPTHLASAVGAAVLALFPPENAVGFAPRGRRGETIQADLERLTVPRVRRALELLLTAR